MKKTGIILLIAFLLVLMVSCSSTEADSKDSSDDSPLTLETPTDQNTFSFDSYESLSMALTAKNSKDYTKLREEQSDFGKVYTRTLSSFASQSVSVGIPQMDGKNLTLRDKEGYANISLLTCELYNLPWLWYHCVVGGDDLDVKIAYPSVLHNEALDHAQSYLDKLALIAPDAPSPENYEQYASYQTIYEKKLCLADGRTVSAMISELKEGDKVYVMFCQDGMMISLQANKELFTDAFWSPFRTVT